ncbi:MAG: hypothetical protein DI601_26435 [Azospirillum brasilense]|nr:hypothetical protein CTJ15_04320 [Roseomonas sp. FDAARGOS_362]PZP38506.1 MAG: hypothetical protein DI601_26435 [Azospirillum brasilense]
MPHVGLHPVQRQDGAALPTQNTPQTAPVGQRDGQQLVVAVQQVGHAALGNLHPTFTQHRV